MNIDLETNKDLILTRDEVRKMLKVSLVTLYKWGQKHIIREHRLGRTVYYLKDELLEDLKKN